MAPATKNTLNAQIEHPCPFAQERAQHAEDQWRSNADGGGPEIGRSENIEQHIHA